MQKDLKIRTRPDLSNGYAHSLPLAPKPQTQLKCTRILYPEPHLPQEHARGDNYNTLFSNSKGKKETNTTSENPDVVSFALSRTLIKHLYLVLVDF